MDFMKKLKSPNSFMKKEYTKSQIKAIQKANEALKNCFVPKDDTIFIEREVKSYLDLLSEILLLPIIVKDIPDQKFELVSINSFLGYRTNFPTKRLILLKSIQSLSNSIFKFNGLDKKGYIKLNTIKRLISNRIFTLKGTTSLVLGKYYWGEKIITEYVSPGSFTKATKRKRFTKIYKALDSNETKVTKKAIIDTKMSGGKHSIFVTEIFLISLETKLIQKEKEIPVADILKHIGVSIRTFYKWNESSRFGITNGKVDIQGLLNFIRYQDIKFLVTTDTKDTNVN